VRDRQASTTTFVDEPYASFASAGRVKISGNGRYVTGNAVPGQSFVYDVRDGVTDWITDGGVGNFFPVISRDGQYLAVLSNDAVAPVPPGTTGWQVFVVPNPAL
jgi:hypothetical protein